MTNFSNGFTIIVAMLMFTVTTNVVAATNALPQANTQAVSNITQGQLTQFTTMSTPDTANNIGYLGYFNQIIKYAIMGITLLISLVFVAYPLMQLGVPVVMAVGINTMFGVIGFIGAYNLWRGNTA